MDLYDILKQLNIPFEEIEHEPVYTIEDAKKAEIEKGIHGMGCKNLFLTNKRGQYVLAILEENKKANINDIQTITNISHLSFASAIQLQEVLLLPPGSVTPFAIIHDKENSVLLVIDQGLKGKKLLFHPNVNTKTISISYDDLIKFIEYENHSYMLMKCN